MQDLNSSSQMHNETTWVTAAPYSAMLTEYNRAAQRLLDRIALLRGELREMKQQKEGTPESARQQTLLEQRIQMLRSEYEDTYDAMESIRGYAEQEVCG